MPEGTAWKKSLIVELEFIIGKIQSFRTKPFIFEMDLCTLKIYTILSVYNSSFVIFFYSLYILSHVLIHQKTIELLFTRLVFFLDHIEINQFIFFPIFFSMFTIYLFFKARSIS